MCSPGRTFLYETTNLDTCMGWPLSNSDATIAGIHSPSEKASFRAGGQRSGRFDFGPLARTPDARSRFAMVPTFGRARDFRAQPDPGPAEPDPGPGAGARIAEHRCVDNQKLIGVRYVRAAGRLIPVRFFRNAGGSVAGRCMLDPKDTPIL